MVSAQAFKGCAMSCLAVAITGSNGDFALNAAFEADAGVTAIFGPSGAGKTTLLKMIAGTQRPTHGRIMIGNITWFDSERRINLPPEQRRIGYVFQDARLFPYMSVLRNLTYARWAGRRSAQRDLDEVIEMLGIRHLLNRRPDTLSGGERQRVAIGRALLSDPSLLLLDEPLSSLDHARRQEILPFIERLRDESGLPILYVSHEVDEVARLADKLVLLKNGVIEASGKTVDLFTLLGEDDEMGVLFEGRVLSRDPQYHLAEVDLGGAIFQLSDQDLHENMLVRLRIRSRDVSIACVLPDQISIRNVLPVTIIAIEKSDGADALLKLKFQQKQLYARLTCRSVDELQLREGEQVFALVKAVSIDRASMRHG